MFLTRDQEFGRLKVLEYSGKDKWGSHLYLCKCSCGSEKIILKQALLKGSTKSCGKCSINTFYEHRDGYMVGVTTKGEEFYFDKEDFDSVKKFSWHVAGGYVATGIYDKEHKRMVIVRLSRFLTKCTIGDGLDVDHKDGNTLDNRKVNLRVCKHNLNTYNQRKSQNKSSKYKGVSYHKRDLIWQAYIKKDMKIFYLGSYLTEEEAAIAYNKKAVELFGEFAKLNMLGEKVPEGKDDDE